jgi:hypothetical protein
MARYDGTRQRLRPPPRATVGGQTLHVLSPQLGGRARSGVAGTSFAQGAQRPGSAHSGH